MADHTSLVVSAVSSRVYVPATEGSPAPPTIDRAVLVVPAAALPLAPSLSVEQAWGVEGAVMVFAASTLITAASLPGAVDMFLAGRGRGAVAAIWIENPADPPGLWRTRTLPVTARTGISGEVSGLATLELRNMQLRIPGGSRLTVCDQPGRWRIDPPPAGGSLAFTSRYGAVTCELTGPITIILGPEQPGTAHFDWWLSPERERAFDVGLHFFAEEPELPGSGILRAPRLALAPCPEQGLAIAATIDPLALTNPERSVLRFTSLPPQLDCTLYDQVGNRLSLAPHNDLRMVFVASPGTVHPGVDEPLCITPIGGADLSTADALVPGLSSSELISLSGPVELHLEPGGAALASAALEQRGSASPLSTRATTGWVRLIPVSDDPLTSEDPLKYFAQPAGAELYTARASSDFLEFLPLAIAHVERETSLPLAPWAGVDPLDVDFDTALEAGGVSPARRLALNGGPRPRRAAPARGAAGEPAPATDTITPQGLLATVAPDGSLETLRLAKIGQDSLSLRGIDGPLLDALMTNRQFVVLSAPATAREFFADSSITVDQWTFTVDPLTWAKHGTMLVIKNSPRSVVELAGEPGAWSQAMALNQLVEETSAQLARFVADAIEQAERSTAYQPIARALEDAAWNGILFINATLPLHSLPDALSGLAPGIDSSRLYAHHLRIDRTPVQRACADAPVLLGADDSAIFALIDYTAAGKLITTDPYAFQVDSLQVLIESSAVSSFASRVTLIANQLFSAPVTSDSGRLQFDGRYQKQQDSYFFALAPGEHPKLVVQDATVESFVVTAGTYATVHDPPPKDESTGATAHSRFCIDGRLSLADTSETSRGTFDLFGFDSLPLTGIAIDVRFNPEQPLLARLGFDLTGALLDAAEASARTGSLPATFPIVAKSLIAGAAGQAPAQLAALPVTVPPAWPGPRAPWYALAFDLDLGTVGALAGSSALIVRLYLQWSPAREAGQWAVGLGLPGATGGSSSISLMGVLKLSIYAINLSTLDSGAFTLSLEGIALSVLSRSIPPGGTLTLALLGDPKAGRSPPLSWYGAYLADKGSAVPSPSLAATARPQLSNPNEQEVVTWPKAP